MHRHISLLTNNKIKDKEFFELRILTYDISDINISWSPDWDLLLETIMPMSNKAK